MDRAKDQVPFILETLQPSTPTTENKVEVIKDEVNDDRPTYSETYM